MRTAVGRICGAMVLALCLAAPAPASAAPEPGVHIDPGSPAAKQYVLQLNQARQTGAQGSQSHSSGGLFGAGIKPPGGGGSATSGPTATGGGPSAQRSGTGFGRHSRSRTAAKPSAPVPLPPAVLRAARAGSSAGSGSWLALVGGGVAVLLLGGFGGTVLRHSRRPRPSS